MNVTKKTFLPRKEYLASLPKKRVSSAAIFLDTAGKVLLVKPTYKDHWSVPGGVADANEAPRSTCEREVKEELNITIASPEFIGVLHRLWKEDGDDVLHFYFYGGVLDDVTIDNIRLQEEELSAFAFVALNELDQYLPKHFIERIVVLHKSISTKKPVYFESAS